SFCFVTDLVDGIIRLFESQLCEPVNIGNPIERTVLDFAQAVRELTGSRSPIQHVPGRPEDPKRRCPDISKARSVLHWEPKVDFREGLKRSLEYFQKCK
ncbi:MAG: GDP-mannose 4,6-dehydratase, partial [Bdellovibrionota bacterium]